METSIHKIKQTCAHWITRQLNVKQLALCIKYYLQAHKLKYVWHKQIINM